MDSEESAASFKLRCLEATPTEQSYIEVWGGGYHIRQVKIQYDSYRPNHVAAVRELRDLLYKVRSLKKLVVRLKEGNLEWESGEEAVRLCQPKFSWKSLNTHGLPSLRSTRVIPRELSY